MRDGEVTPQGRAEVRALSATSALTIRDYQAGSFDRFSNAPSADSAALSSGILFEPSSPSPLPLPPPFPIDASRAAARGLEPMSLINQEPSEICTRIIGLQEAPTRRLAW